jgi:N-acetylmuramoyl-L-alanine amidase
MRKVEILVIHCTATRQGVAVTPDEIRRWHTAPPPAGRGWRQVGYTDMIALDGQMHRLAPNNDDGIVDPWEITNGVKGMNSRIRSIVYVGGLDASGKKPKDTRTIEQKEALRKYVAAFVCRNPLVKVAGHNQFSNKACPSFDVPVWLKSIGVKPENIYNE